MRKRAIGKLALFAALVLLTGCHPHWLFGVCRAELRDRGWFYAPVAVFISPTDSTPLIAKDSIMLVHWVDTVCVEH